MVLEYSEKYDCGTNNRTFVTLTKSSHLNPFCITIQASNRKKKRKKKIFLQILEFCIGFHYNGNIILQL